jgi:hypothetical protein
MTATQMIQAAIAEGAQFTLDHETRAFVGFRFRLASDARDTVVRIRRDAAEFATVAARAHRS